MANEQLCKTRFVRITRAALAIRLNPLRVLRAERIVHLALKLGVTRNFRKGRQMHCAHPLTPHVLVTRKPIQDSVPSTFGIKDRHVQHQHRIVTPPWSTKQAARLQPNRSLGLLSIRSDHFVISIYFLSINQKDGQEAQCRAD
jgi:hypothetical protein